MKNKGQSPIQYAMVILVIVALVGSWMAYSSAGQASTKRLAKEKDVKGLAKEKDVSDLKNRIATLEKRIKSLKERQSTILEKIGAKPPAKLTATSISVPPVKVGETATATVTVVNTGGKEGSKDIPLKINGEAVKTKHVIVPAGASKTISFDIRMDKSGDYTVSALGVSTSWSVEAKPKKGRMYGLSTKIIHNVWEAFNAKCFQWYSMDKGWKPVVLQAHNNATLQNTQIHRLVDMGCDGVVVGAFNADVAAKGVSYAVNQGVPVFTQNADVNSDKVIMYTGYSGVRGSKQCAKRMVDYLKNEVDPAARDPGYWILEIRGPMGGASAEDRHQGFYNYVQDWKKEANAEVHVKTVCGKYKREIAIKKALPAMRAKKYDAIYSGNGPMCMGAVAAARKLGNYSKSYIKEMHISTIDAMPAVIDEIEKGYIDCAFDQPVQFYTPISLYYMNKWIKAGKSATDEPGPGGPLPDKGEKVTAEEVTFNTGEKHAGIAIWKTPMWAPAQITEASGDWGSHLWFQTNGIMVDETNYDNPALWGNLELPGW